MKDAELKYDFVDALRGIAILLVLTAHNYLGFLCEQSQYPHWFGALIYQGVYGVQLFYIVSAFTLFLSLSQRNDEPIRYADFYIRRFFRIAPLFYITILFFVMKGSLEETNYGFWQVLSTLSFTNGFFINWINGMFFGSWSIAIEMPFYLLVPFLFIYIKDLNRAVLFFIITVIVARLMVIILKHTILVQEPGFNQFLYFYLPAQLPIFALGIILFFLVQSDMFSVKPSTLLILSLLFIAHYVLGGIGIVAPFVLLSIGFLGFAYSLYRIKPVLFINKFSIFIGKISYGIYLSHWAIFDLISVLKLSYLSGHSVFNFFFRQIFIIAFCVPLAYLLHCVVEGPFQSFGQTLIKQLKQRTT